MEPKPFNGLTPEVAELLAVLAEECGEVVQRVGKILRHGLRDNPYTGQSNAEGLEAELRDVIALVRLLDYLNVISWKSISDQRLIIEKMDRLGRPGMLHHSSLLRPKSCMICGSTATEQVDHPDGGAMCCTHISLFDPNGNKLW